MTMTDGRGMADPVARRLLTASVLIVTLMNTLDMTIANVALPHMQGLFFVGGSDHLGAHLINMLSFYLIKFIYKFQ